MQIDFHHAVTYVAARLANFPVSEAKIVSYCAQYVDDAVNSGTIHFRNKAMYSRISSAHKMLDYRNFKELANHFTWVPFHFLPGNAGKKPGENPSGSFINKLVCRPDSYVAKDMVRSCISDHGQSYGLHRLGITLHVLADTFAHQNFAGINHKINDVENLKKEGESPSTLLEKLSDYFGDLFDTIANKVVGDVFPLGHGAALSLPDQPYLKWGYTNGLGQQIERDNTDIFMAAVKSMHHALVCYKKQDPDYELLSEEQIPENDLNQIRENFLSFIDEDGEIRHDRWLQSIASGAFSFADQGEEILTYAPKGRGSWKHQALDTKSEIETKTEKFKFSSDFMESDWKLFHDALQIHRIDIIRNILPGYGICAA